MLKQFFVFFLAIYLIRSSDFKILNKPRNSTLTKYCGKSYGDFRIVKGKLTTPYSHPWIVNLRIQNGYSINFKCGGSLISLNHILTAAHCVHKVNNPYQIIAIFGVHNLCFTDTLNGNYIMRRIQKISIHEKYDRDEFLNDIAILKFEKAVPITYSIRPILLPFTWNSFANVTSTVAGWGSVYQGGPLSCQLLQTNLPVITNDNCRFYYKWAKITSGHLCTLYSNPSNLTDACQGDSGGPLVMKIDQKYVQIGVVSWGKGCALPNSPGVYTRLSKYIYWIDDILGSQKFCDFVEV